MHRVICSTGALLGMPNGRNFYLVRECVDKLRCDAYEFMMYDTWYPRAEELAKFLASLPVEIPYWHCEKRIGEQFSLRRPGDWEEALQKFELNCQLAVFLGAKQMVLHLWDGPVSDQHFQNNLEIYPLLLKIAQKHSITLLVENVVCNCGDPLAHWQTLRDQYPDVRFVFDTKMAAFHGQMEAIYQPDFRPCWENHIRHLHINDYGGGYMDWQNLKTLHVGKGNVDFCRFFSFLKTLPYSGDFTVEATSFVPDGVIRCDDLNRTFDYIREHM